MTMTAPDDELSAGLYIQKQMLPEWRIKKAKLIDDIVKLLRPTEQERDASREDVARVTLHVACANALMRAKDQGSTKPGKRAAGQLASTLRRIDAVLNNPALDSMLRATVRAQTPADKSKELARSAENFMTAPSGKLTRKTAEEKRFAIEQAHSLMIKYSPSTAENAGRGSPLCKISAALYGKPDSDLSSQCMTFLRKRGLKKRAAPS
jgi:hypothetical protein